jgi:hypothetical protein
VPLSEAFKAVGRVSYGEDWVGDRAVALTRLTAQIRYKGPKSPEERSLVEQEKKAAEQRTETMNFLRTEFLGSPPLFDDAVPVQMIADDDGAIYTLKPQIWIDDQEAWQMLASGRVMFHPLARNWRWAPTELQISGALLLAESALPNSTAASAQDAASITPAKGPAQDTLSAERTSAKPRRLRREQDHWPLARAEALKWLDYEGAPMALGDQAKLEKHIEEFLARQDIHPAESTIRDHVKKWIAEFEQTPRAQVIDP